MYEEAACWPASATASVTHRPFIEVVVFHGNRGHSHLPGVSSGSSGCLIL
jgi:hypothetical protein